jgi:hypothetical protein
MPRQLHKIMKQPLKMIILILFSLKKGGPGNYSKNSQSGQFSLETGEEKVLASLKINIQKEEE